MPQDVPGQLYRTPDGRIIYVRAGEDPNVVAAQQGTRLPSSDPDEAALESAVAADNAPPGAGPSVGLQGPGGQAGPSLGIPEGGQMPIGLQDFGRGLATAGTMGIGMSPIGLLPRMALTGMGGAVQGMLKPEGEQDPWQSAMYESALEGLGGAAAPIIRGSTKLGGWMNLQHIPKDVTQSFANQAQRAGLRRGYQGPSLGGHGAASARRRAANVVGPDIRAVSETSPYQGSIMDIVEGGRDAALRSPGMTHTPSVPRVRQPGRLNRSVDREEFATIKDQLETRGGTDLGTLIKERFGLDDKQLRAMDQASIREAAEKMATETRVPPGELHDIAGDMKRTGQAVEVSQRTPGNTMSREAAATRGAAPLGAGRTIDNKLDEVTPRRRELRTEYHDLMNIAEAGERALSTPASVLRRGGLGAMVGYPTGGEMGGKVGAILAALGGPSVVSRGGQVAALGARSAPIVDRSRRTFGDVGEGTDTFLDSLDPNDPDQAALLRLFRGE